MHSDLHGRPGIASTAEVSYGVERPWVLQLERAAKSVNLPNLLLHQVIDHVV